MNKRLPAYYFIFTTIIIGYFLAVQLKSVDDPYQGIVTIPKIMEMRNEIESINKEMKNLASSINESKLKLEEYEKSMGKGDGLDENMKKELETARIYADYEKVEGPGIIITMNDSVAEVGEYENEDMYLIHDADILEIVNELRAAGAEAISINDERVTATSNIRCGGPTINVDGKRHAVPFVIKAIGDPITLETVTTSPDAYITLMEYYEIRFNIQKVEKMTIYPYDGGYKLNYQKKIEDGE